MMRRIALSGLILLFGTVAWLSYNYQASNLETATLSMAERKAAGVPGEFLQTFDGVVHYQLDGPADAKHTIVLVHGFSVPYYLWDGTFETLVRAGHRVLRYDLFGRGYSDRPGLEYNGELFDRQLVELLNALRIRDRVDLVGASMGASIAAGFACRHKERVRSVTMIGPGYSKGGPLSWRLALPVIGEYHFATSIVPDLPNSQMQDFKYPAKFPDWAERYKPQMKYVGFRKALLSTLRNYATTDWTMEYACLGKSGLPVLLIWGKDDQDVPFQLSEQVRKDLPQAQFLPIDDAAHLPFLEKPELVLPVMLEFLGTNP